MEPEAAYDPLLSGHAVLSFWALLLRLCSLCPRHQVDREMEFALAARDFSPGSEPVGLEGPILREVGGEQDLLELSLQITR